MKNEKNDNVIDVAHTCAELIAQLSDTDAEQVLEWLASGEWIAAEAKPRARKTSTSAKAKHKAKKANGKANGKAKANGEKRGPGRPSFRADQIVAFVEKHPGCSPKDIADKIEINYGHAAATIARLVDQGRLVKTGRGAYEAKT